MLNQKEILSTIAMIDQQHLDIRTITMGISLLSCCDPDAKKACDKIYEKITRYAEKLVKTGEDIQHEFGIPIVNKRISVTPMALVAGASETEDYVPFAMALDRAAKTCGVNFIGGYSALVQKGMTLADEKLIRSIPEALDRTELVCSSINREAHGPHHQGYRRPDGGPGRSWLRQAGGVLQRRGGQPLHGRRLPRRGRGRTGH